MDINMPSLNIVEGRDYTRGSSGARIELLEYGDYECPYSRLGYRFVQILLRKEDPPIRFAFRNFPLRKLHPNAQTCAEAALAAGVQGKFWEMHDLLFDNNRELGREKLMEIAEQVGLNMNRFLADLEQDNFRPRVTEDFRSGVNAGVQKTPTFFADGHKFEGELDYGALKSFIDEVAEGS